MIEFLGAFHCRMTWTLRSPHITATSKIGSSSFSLISLGPATTVIFSMDGQNASWRNSPRLNGITASTSSREHKTYSTSYHASVEMYITSHTPDEIGRAH